MTVRTLAFLNGPGIIVPPLTPFGPDGAVDYQALGQEIDYLIDRVDPVMLAVAATEVQEYQYLSDQGRAELVRRTADIVQGRVPLLVGASHPSLRQVEALCRLAEEVGGAAVQVLIPRRPSGGRPSREELLAYFTAVIQGANLPVFAYHNPSAALQVPPEVLAAITQIPGVVAIKESSQNLRHIGLSMALCAPGVHHFATLEVLLASLDIGGAGGFLPPVMASVGKAVVDAYREGRWQDAQEIQRAASQFPGPWQRHGLASVLKAALEVEGVPMGSSYPPFGTLAAPEREQLHEYVAGLTLWHR